MYLADAQTKIAGFFGVDLKPQNRDWSYLSVNYQDFHETLNADWQRQDISQLIDRSVRDYLVWSRAELFYCLASLP